MFNNVLPNPFSSAALEFMTGPNCLWSPAKTTWPRSSRIPPIAIATSGSTACAASSINTWDRLKSLVYLKIKIIKFVNNLYKY